MNLVSSFPQIKFPLSMEYYTENFYAYQYLLQTASYEIYG